MGIKSNNKLNPLTMKSTGLVTMMMMMMLVVVCMFNAH